jgi:hypothetical protein
LKKEKILKESEKELQEYLHMKVKNNIFKKKSVQKNNFKLSSGKRTKNHDITLGFFKK